MSTTYYGNSVFINCPFDAEYREIFDAVVFTVYKCKFIPRCALETADASQNRIDKILQIIEECRYGIHDISRTSFGIEGLTRFNMPLELGLFLGAKRFGVSEQRQKQCLVLDTQRYRYQKFISDLAGVDVTPHNNRARNALVGVRDWFADKRRAGIPSGGLIWKEYKQFRRALPMICERLKLLPPELIFRDYAQVVFEWLESQERTIR